MEVIVIRTRSRPGLVRNVGALVMVASTGMAGAGPARHVDPFIGTGGHGHTFPGATLPFGMVQLSPDTRLEGWDGCSGYHYTDNVVYGFSHTHLSGTGIPDYCDILFMPTTGDVTLTNGYPDKTDEGYASRFSKSSEKASPGYYEVHLDDYDIDVAGTRKDGNGGTYGLAIPVPKFCVEKVALSCI